jgi:hypothetical protein
MCARPVIRVQHGVQIANRSAFLENMSTSKKKFRTKMAKGFKNVAAGSQNG